MKYNISYLKKLTLDLMNSKCKKMKRTQNKEAHENLCHNG